MTRGETMMGRVWILCAMVALVACDAGKEEKKPEAPAPEAKEAKPKEGVAKPTPAAKPKAEADGISISTSLDETQKENAARLSKKIKRGKFPWAEQNKKENADIFLYLAATSEDEEVIGAALHGMSRSWTHWKKNDKKKHVNADYQKVVRTHLESKSPVVLGRAIEASPNAVGVQNPDGKIVGKLTAMIQSHENPAVRVASVEAVARAKEFQKDKAVVGAMLKALGDKEPYVVSSALFRMQFLAYSIVRKPELYTKAKALLGHKDQGVRGRAVVLAANLAPSEQRQEIGAMILPLLKDESPFVRSSAAKALATLKRTDTIHTLMGMLGDSAPNKYTLKYTKITGEPGSVIHDGSAWSRVDEAVLYAIKTMTWSMGEKKFKYGKINYKTVEKDIAAAIKEARKWYKKHRKSLPPAPK